VSEKRPIQTLVMGIESIVSWTTNRRCVLLILVAVTALVMVAMPKQASSRDQGIFAYIGWRWLEGHIPYQDGGVEVKGPGIYLLYAAAFRLFGISLHSARLTDTLWRFLTVATFLALLLAIHRRVTISVWIGGLFYSIMGTYRERLAAQTESFMDLPLILCFLAAYHALESKDRQQLTWMAASGAACGIASSIKLTGLFPLGALALYLAVELMAQRISLRETTRLVAAWLLGLSAALLPLVIYFAAHGALGDMADIVWTFNRYNAHQSVSRATISVLVAFFIGIVPNLLNFSLLHMGALIGIGIILVEERQQHRTAALIIWWLIAAYVTLGLQGKFFPYHFIILAAPLSIASGHGLGRIVERAHTFPHHWLAVGLVATLGTVISLRQADLWQSLIERVRMNEEKTMVSGEGDHDYDVDIAVATYLSEHTDPDECILVWGYEPLIYFLARRSACTRYIFDYPLTCQYAPESWLSKTRGIFLEEIDALPPAYIAVAHEDINPVESEDSAQQLSQFPQLAAKVRRDYCLETLIGNFEVYRRCVPVRK
jgi:hypothetical protein